MFQHLASSVGRWAPFLRAHTISRLHVRFPAGVLAALLSLTIFVVFGFNAALGGTHSVAADGPTPPRLGVVFSSDGSKLAAVGAEGAVTVLDLESGRESSVLGEASGMVGALAFSPDGRTLAGASEDRISVWDLSGARETIFLKASSGRSIARLAFNPSGDGVAAVVDDHAITFWDLHKSPP